jgi:hypothetical protein
VRISFLLIFFLLEVIYMFLINILIEKTNVIDNES